MANTKERIVKELKRQQKIEGYTPETGLLLKVLPLIKTNCQLRELFKTEWHDNKRFYYPSKLLLDLQEFFTHE